ncbi:Putative 115 kDa protein in type-1 retrotransposable element R1DM [Eumeta japonica]|uniref:115 kDa protein in type-1 retrotransposable element R1DM n=1 Tax=Eumeta variegata TaxID=151549 RepID=A0A4C1U7Y0_EUMVA|nr:Putative 115 kDa protein in type-1 retrotransposable element R1DM [Eumeta japonica]
MPSPTSPKLLKKIVTALFPQKRQFDYPTAQDKSEEIPPVTEKELMNACNRLGNNKALGLDGIPNIALKTATKAALALFTETYDTCLKEGYFPNRWKQQRLVLLSKGKKPLEEPSSYRSLCKLDTASKILEHIIHHRIEVVVDSLLADNQYGFRKERSTRDTINIVVNTGSVIRPLLCNIMYDGLLKVPLPTEVKLMAYADDVAVVIVAKHLDIHHLVFDKAFERINQWMDTVNL